METDPLRAVVIGSGVGGAAAALLLAHAGVPTILIERERRLGGSCSGYERDGFRIDTGAHMFCRGDEGAIGDVLRRVGGSDALSFKRRRGALGLWVDPIDPCAAPARGAACVELHAELHRLPWLARRIARGLGLSALEAARAARLLAHVLAMREVDLAAWDDVTVADYVARFLRRHAAVARLGALIALPLMLPSAEASAGEALWSLRRLLGGGPLRYPEGGVSQVPAAFCRLAREHGAEVRTGVSVRRIVVQDGRVRGVELDDGAVLPASLVVSTAGLQTTVARLVGEAHFPEAFVARVRAIRPQPRCVHLRIGLRAPLVEASAILGVLDGVGAACSPFYCAVPTSFDPALVPRGHQLLSAYAVIGEGAGAGAVSNALLRTLSRAVPGLLDHAVFVDSSPEGARGEPSASEADPDAGAAQIPGQVGRARPAVHTPVRGLYLAGRAAGGRGVGMERSALSAMECVDRILVDLGHDLGAPAPRALTGIAGDLLVRAARPPLLWATRPRGRA